MLMKFLCITVIVAIISWLHSTHYVIINHYAEDQTRLSPKWNFLTSMTEDFIFSLVLYCIVNENSLYKKEKWFIKFSFNNNQKIIRILNDV